VNTALQRAVELLADPPSNPDVSKGYLDLLGSVPADTPKNTGLIQAAWASPIGSMLYDRAQLLARQVMTGFQHPAEWLGIPPGGVALDVGSGPGNVTAAMGRAAGPDGLALGVDISEPMLARAVRAEAGAQVGFVRADSQRLPFRDERFDATVSIAMLQLIPEPPVALAEMVRVLRPGGRIAVMVPTAGRAAGLMRLLPSGGAHFFTDDEIADVFEDLGLTRVRSKNFGSIQWVRGKKP
jgi:SAM-dependent methyltransferase